MFKDGKRAFSLLYLLPDLLTRFLGFEPKPCARKQPPINLLQYGLHRCYESIGWEEGVYGA